MDNEAGPSIPWEEVFREDIAKYGKPGLALRGVRLREEMTQAALAKILGIRQHHVSEMEHGSRPIGKDMAKRLAEVLNIGYRVFL